MNIVAIIQARTGSTRFPNKVFAELSSKPLIWHVVDRLKYSKRINQIVLATTLNISDNILEKWANDNNVICFRGSEEDVLERYYLAALKNKADIIVRITADDPFKDPYIIDDTIQMLIENDLDIAFNNNPVSFPEGLDVEVFTFKSLERAFNESESSYEREHVTQFFYKNGSLFKMKNLSYEKDISYLRWTIDTQTDLKMAEAVYNQLYTDDDIFCLNDILHLLKLEPNIAEINSDEGRSDMYKKK